MHTACRPVFAIMNPELTYSVSQYQTGAGSADILAHTVSRYFTASSSKLGDEYCEGTMRTVVKYASKAIAKPNDYEARAELMLPALLAITMSPASDAPMRQEEVSMRWKYNSVGHMILRMALDWR